MTGDAGQAGGNRDTGEAARSERAGRDAPMPEAGPDATPESLPGTVPDTMPVVGPEALPDTRPESPTEDPRRLAAQGLLAPDSDLDRYSDPARTDLARTDLARTDPARTDPGAGLHRGAAHEAAPPSPAVLPPRRRRPIHHHALRVCIGLGALLLVLCVLAGMAALAFTGRPVALPGWAVDRIEARVNQALAGQGHVDVGGIEILVDSDMIPRTRLRQVELYSAAGAPVAMLPELRASFRPEGLLRGRVEPRNFRITGAQLRLTRSPDGRLDFAFGGGQGALKFGDLPEFLGQLEQSFRLPALASLAWIRVDALNIVYDDQRAGQTWTVSDGQLNFDQTDAHLALGLSFRLAGDDGAPASAQLSLTTSKTGPEATAQANVTGIEARLLAAQAPALAWLGVLDAPISGALRTGIDDKGHVSQLDGTLEIGKGALRPVDNIRPLPFDGAKVYLGYDPSQGRIDFRDIRVSGPALTVGGHATAWLQDIRNGLPRALVAQVALSDLQADPQGLFPEPVVFPQGMMDFKLELAPFRLTLGQFALVDAEGRRIEARGEASAGPEGWNMSLDTSLDRIAHDRLLALWPVSLVPKTRGWLAENVTTGELHDVHAAFRLRPNAEPQVALQYAFSGAEVRVLKTLPPVQDGRGYATINGRTHTLVVEEGHAVAPNGQPVRMDGSVVTVPDITAKPTPIEITLKTDSSIPAALSLLDEPPFRLLSRIGKGTDLAEGRAKAETHLAFNLVKDIDPDDIHYDVAADLTDVRSTVLVPGKVLTAPHLALAASPRGMTLGGAGALEGVPLSATFTQPFGAGSKGKGRVEGTAELTAAGLAAFGIALPEGMVSGQGALSFALALPEGAPPELTLQSDLTGIALSLADLGWTKPAATPGKLAVTAKMTVPVSVPELKLSAPGLSAAGDVTLNRDGSLGRVRLAEASLGNWFDGSVELRGQGKGRGVAVAVTGGRADLSKAKLGGAGGGASSGSSATSVPISVALDRVTVSKGLWLGRMRGDFSTGGGFAGKFTGLVNGEAPITGTLAPTRGNGLTGVRLQAADAGLVIRTMGIFPKAAGGRMDLILTPTGPKGTYDGQVNIADIRMKDAPVAAALLNAVSIVGLVEQLGGEGILFNSVDGRFNLTPDRVRIDDLVAQGASMGVTLQGSYGLASKRMELQGVVSPVYLFNAVGQLVSRRGEGLFGFNYTVSGTADQPKVSVNPLSILTPGMFRDLFRTDPPEVKK